MIHDCQIYRECSACPDWQECQKDDFDDDREMIQPNGYYTPRE